MNTTAEKSVISRTRLNNLYMKKHFVLVIMAIFTLVSLQGYAQKEAIEESLDRRTAISDFRFLASDELMGRDAMRSEIDVAARYIAEQFWKYEAKELDGAEGYYHTVPFKVSYPATYGEIKMADQSFVLGEDLLVLAGVDQLGNYPIVTAGYGLENDLQGKDLKGKILVVKVGKPGDTSPSQWLATGREKLKLARVKGAVGLIELYNQPNISWEMLTNYLSRPQFNIDEQVDGEEEPLPYFWIQDVSDKWMSAIDQKSTLRAEINIQGKTDRKISGRNVVAYIEGTDPELKDEYLMLSAHYDHIGVGEPNAEGDSIYNGARDNAVGTVALINAARYFSKNPPKRSILLCAWTAEEKGLLGSRYFAENPLVPLNKIIYNLNIDNAGYNDTSIITVIGLGRTSVDGLIEQAVSETGLTAISDPSPEQGLYDRSDNVNFARKGIPAPTFSLGFTAFDEEIMKYYHQVPDQVDNFDLDYAMLYWTAYLLSADYVANADEQPIWVEGDKYEEAGNQLYGIP